jgi:hypothetical protein
LAAFLGVLILAAVPLEDELAFSLATFTAVFYVALGLLADRSDFPASAWVLKAVGFAGYFALLYIYSFAEAVEVLDDLSLAKPAVQAYFWVSLLLAALAWLATPVLGLRRLSVYWQWHWGLLAVPLVVVAAVSLEILPLTDWVAAIPFNLVILGHCIVFILQGTRAGDVKLVSIACVLFTALIFARYVDLFESLLLRSAIFLALGAGIFVVGNFYNRSKRWLEGTAG